MYSLVILFLTFEALDFVLNPSTSIKGLVYGYTRRWAKNPFFFLITQFNFIFLTFCVFGLGLSSATLLFLYMFYGFDSAYKIYLSDKIIKDELNKEIEMLLNSDFSVPFWQRVAVSSTAALIFYIGIS